MIVPDFYAAFVCKAGACQHSCCRQSWEIDIDPVTADYYAQLPVPLGEELRQFMQKGPDGAYFAMEKGQCHFLRPDGLCRLVLELGEEALCDICALHPRFFEYPLDAAGKEWELGGVGLCCEKTCDLILQDTPLTFVDSEAPEKAYSLADVLKGLGYEAAPALLTYQAEKLPSQGLPYVQALLKLLHQTEPIDDAWTQHVTTLIQQAEVLLAKIPAFVKTIPPAWLDRIYQYLFYRQLEAYPDAKQLSHFAQVNTDFIVLSAALTGDLPEALRRWSEQIEYDTDNVDLLMQSL